MKIIGAHFSIQNGLGNAIRNAEKCGCNALQIFTGNPMSWQVKNLLANDISDFLKAKKETGISNIISHSSYLINLASPDPEQIKRSVDALIVEIERCETLRIPYLVLHPGSHKGTGEQGGIKSIAGNLDLVISQTSGFNTMILLETTAGQGNTIGHKFEHLAGIINKLKDSSRAGVCYDTCHTFAAGYDIRTEKSYNATFSKFDQVIGLEKLKAFHINDSKNDINTKKDRHEHIGKGKIGKNAFSLLLNDSRFNQIPMVLETPKGKDYKEDRENLALLRSMRK